MDGRDPKTGRFVTGNAGGPGAPKGHKRNQLAEAFYKALTTKDVLKVVASMLKEAKAGDSKAASLLLDRFVAKMPQGIELDVISKLEGVVELNFGDES